MKWLKDGLGTLMVSLFGMTKTIPKEHPYYEILTKALDKGDADTFLKFCEIGEAIENWSCGNFTCKNGVIFFQKKEVVPVLQKHLDSIIREAGDPRPFLRFMVKVYDASQYENSKIDEDLFTLRVDSLWDWLQNQNLHLTTDGNFLAYKYVSVYEGEDIVSKDGDIISEGDYVDAHTGCTHRNNVGDKPRMPVEEVNRSRDQCAGAGLHCGNKGYAANQKHAVIVEVDPRDVVVVPERHACKIRTIGYKVVSHYTNDLSARNYRVIEDDIEECPDKFDPYEDDWTLDFESEDSWS